MNLETEAEEESAYPFFEAYILDAKSTPHLEKLFGGVDKVSKSHLNVLFLEMIKLISRSKSAVEFEYNDGTKGCAIIVPRVKNRESFNRQARRTCWIQQLIHHIATGESDENDGAQWLIEYMGKKYDTAFTLASESLGFPLVQCMDEVSTKAM